MRKKIVSKIIAVVSVLMCFAVIFSSTGVYAANDTQPDAKGDTVEVRFIFVFFRDAPGFFSNIKSVLWFGDKVRVLGYNGIYTHVENLDSKEKGYIFGDFLNDDEEGSLSFEGNEDDDDVYVGKTNKGRLKVVYNGNKAVKWSSSPEGYISINQDTGVITGIKPGTVEVTVTAGEKSIKATVTCINEWKEPETAKAEKNIVVKKHPGDEYESEGTISKGAAISARGDLADGSGWIYVNSGSLWGFIKLSEFPEIDYLFTEYHYYDQGYNIRFGSASTKIYTYASVINDVMMDLFKLKINPYVYSYTSPADQCKVLQYDSVKSNNLASSCPKNGNHNDESCLTSKSLRDNLQNTFGAGNEYIAKTAWTGHIMDENAMSNSQRNPSFILIFTTGNTVNKSTYQNKSASVIRSRSIYELIHETSHQFELHDHYCKKNGSPCTNQYCYSCTRGYSAPRCIMNLPFDTENYNNDELFCDECLDSIKTHLNDHH